MSDATEIENLNDVEKASGKKTTRVNPRWFAVLSDGDKFEVVVCERKAELRNRISGYPGVIHYIIKGYHQPVKVAIDF